MKKISREITKKSLGNNNSRIPLHTHSLNHYIQIYEEMLKKGKISKGGSAHNRMMYFIKVRDSIPR